jgi:MerR family transcriptional regulator, light-induced transcriptional regulator
VSSLCLVFVYTAAVSVPSLRIGEVSRRTGLSPEVLRVWERRYGVLQPARSSGGFRLYSDADVARVARMQRLLDDGLSPAEAALVVAEQPEPPAAATGHDASASAAELVAALAAFDEPAAQATVDRLFDELTTEAVLRDVVIPVLHEVGERWERGELSVAQEHFASNVIRGRLLGLARGWARGIGPQALLACPPGERHDLGLIAFGIALNRLGWRIAFLGADTPYDTLAGAADAVRPAAIVLALVWKPDGDDLPTLERLAAAHRLYLAGQAASSELAERLGATLLEGDPVTVAEQVARGARAAARA